MQPRISTNRETIRELLIRGWIEGASEFRESQGEPEEVTKAGLRELALASKVVKDFDTSWPDPRRPGTNVPKLDGAF